MGTQDTVSQLGLGVGAFSIVLIQALQAGWSLLASILTGLVPLILAPVLVRLTTQKVTGKLAIRDNHKSHIVEKAVRPLIDSFRSDSFEKFAERKGPLQGLLRVDIPAAFPNDSPGHSAWGWLREHDSAFDEAWNRYEAARVETQNLLDKCSNQVFDQLVDGTECKPGAHRRARANLEISPVTTPIQIASLARDHANREEIPPVEIREGPHFPPELRVGNTPVVHGPLPQVEQIAENLEAAVRDEGNAELATALRNQLTELSDAREELLKVADRIVEEGGPRGTCSRCSWRALLRK